MKAILIIDHGSVRAEANNMLECVANLVQAMAGGDVIVRFAHMELAEPLIPEGFARCVSAGATEVVVFPYMLSPGKHSTRDIPRMVAEAAAAFPHVAYTVSSAFGVHDKLAEVILDRAGVRAAPAPRVDGRVCCMRPAGAAERFCGDGCRELATAPAPAPAAPAASGAALA
ncbi:MAG: CbiX/SirB N-terminal domain-containing protein [Gemmatimonadaceae bacterium]